MRRRLAQLDSLTAREREVLALLGRGLSMPEIARRLHRSPKTVESHRLALGRKLKASNRVELARIAITAGLAPLSEAATDEQQFGELRSKLDSDTVAWNAMRELDVGLAACTGHAYLRELLTRLCHALCVRSAMLSENTDAADPPHRDILLTLHDGTVHQWERLPLPGTPCEIVQREGFLRLDERLAARFPGSPPAQCGATRAFIGVRLNSAQQTPIGMLAVAHDAAFDDRTQPEVILRICASRAAAELERARMDERLLEANELLEKRVQQRTEQLQQANRRLQHQLEQTRHAQHQLERSEQRFRTLIETMNEGVAVMDAHGTLTYVNERFTRMLRCTREELIGCSPTEFIADASAAAWFSAQEFDRRRNTLTPYQLPLRRKDGTTLRVHVSPRSLYDEDGQYVGSFGVVSEIAKQP